VKATGFVFCLTHNHTGYPLVRQARAMVEAGQLGEIRLVQVEYVQGHKADERDPEPGEDLPWRYDPVHGGPSLVMGDIGTHAHNLIRFVRSSRWPRSRLRSDTSSPVGPLTTMGSPCSDSTKALAEFFWVPQTAAGVENGLRIRVSGTLGSLDWYQERPIRLLVTPLQGPRMTFTPNGPGILPAAARASRIVAGHPEGFHEAFANLYSDAAEAIAARRTGTTADPLALQFPNEIDGAVGVKFVEAAMASSAADGVWTDALLTFDEGR
jgi:predicted dehydrogenase